jgi:hypothetical protein
LGNSGGQLRGRISTLAITDPLAAQTVWSTVTSRDGTSVAYAFKLPGGVYPQAIFS